MDGRGGKEILSNLKRPSLELDMVELATDNDHVEPS